jgi:large subunit ribosomal protein L22
MYSIKFDEENNIVGKARNEAIDASFKDLCAVCDNIRGMNVVNAIELLEKAKRMEVPIRYRKFNKKLGHRRELGGKKGRYPVKAVKYVLKLLKDAINNALVKGAEKEKLVVAHAAANKKASYYRLQPKGLRIPHNFELARLEIIVIQKDKKPVKKSVKEEIKEKAGEEKQEQATKQEKQENIKQEIKQNEKEGKGTESNDKKK